VPKQYQAAVGKEGVMEAMSINYFLRSWKVKKSRKL
jgi:hypothetical protein